MHSGASQSTNTVRVRDCSARAAKHAMLTPYLWGDATNMYGPTMLGIHMLLLQNT
jgi:hypothetical protein